MCNLLITGVTTLIKFSKQWNNDKLAKHLTCQKDNNGEVLIHSKCRKDYTNQRRLDSFLKKEVINDRRLPASPWNNLNGRNNASAVVLMPVKIKAPALKYCSSRNDHSIQKNHLEIMQAETQ